MCKQTKDRIKQLNQYVEKNGREQVAKSNKRNMEEEKRESLERCRSKVV